MVAEAVDDELLARFGEYLRASALAPRTVANYLADMRAFVRWYAAANGGAALSDLTAEDVEEFCRHMGNDEGWVPSTVNRRLQAVRKFCSFAVEMGLMEDNPAAKVKLLGVRPAAPRSLAPHEVERLLGAVRGKRPGLVKRDYAIIRLLLATGIKVGELVDLRLSDLRLGEDGGWLTVGSDRRCIPLDAATCAALRDYLRVRPASPGVENLFLSQEGAPISSRTVQRLVSAYAEEAGLEGVSPRVLRHTFAKSMLKEMGDLAAVARLLGHRSLETTAKYLEDGGGVSPRSE